MKFILLEMDRILRPSGYVDAKRFIPDLRHFLRSKINLNQQRSPKKMRSGGDQMNKRSLRSSIVSIASQWRCYGRKSPDSGFGVVDLDTVVVGELGEVYFKEEAKFFQHLKEKGSMA